MKPHIRTTIATIATVATIAAILLTGLSASACVVRPGHNSRQVYYPADQYLPLPQHQYGRGYERPGYAYYPPPHQKPQRRGNDKIVCDRSDRECYAWDKKRHRYRPAFQTTEKIFGGRAEDRQRDRWHR